MRARSIGPLPPAVPPAPESAVVADLLGVASVELALLAPRPGNAPAEVRIDIPADGEIWTLALVPWSIRSDRFGILVETAAGTFVPHPEPPVETWRGAVLGMPGSTVRARFDGERLRAIVRTSGGVRIVQPAADCGTAGTEPWHVVHDAADLLPSPSECATPDGHGTIGGAPGPSLTGGQALSVLEIAADADFELYTARGSSVDATVHDIEAILNGVEGLFEAEPVCIGFELTAVVVRTTASDPYGAETDPALLLDLVDATWSAAPVSGIPRDLAHLFTGVDLAGSLVGISNAAELCTPESTGISQTLFSASFASRVALTAHELGHNASAAHCDGGAPCRILCATIGGCDGLSPFELEASTAAAIAAFRSTLPCLSVRPAPLVLPVLDEFTVNALDPALWVHVDGAIVSSQGVGEPSAPNSLQLDTTGPGPFDRDEIRSNRVLLAGSAVPVLGFSVEHRGVEAGEALVVEFRDPAYAWVEIARVESDGVDGTAYTPLEIALPPAARHDGFRLRLRVEADEPDDDWYVDDLRIEDAGALFVRGDANGDGALDIGDAVAILAHLFAGDPAPCPDANDANDDGVADIADAIALLAHLFSAAAPPPAPHPDPGTDPTADALGCGG